MFGDPFYNQSLRKTVIAFGSLFNEIYIQRKEGETTKEQIRVPLTYTGKEKFRAMLRSFETIDKDVGSILPRMGFSMTSLTYDPTRKRNTIQKRYAASNTNSNLQYDYAEVPYNLEFELNIAVRNMDDGLQIVEQIVPNFTPDFTVSVNFTEIHKKIDVPIVLTGVVDSIEADGELDEPRAILFTLTFTAGTYIYTKPRESGIITKTTADVFNADFSGGLTGQFFQSVVEATNIVGQTAGSFGVTSHHRDFINEPVSAYEARSGLYIFELPDLYKEPGSQMGEHPRLFFTSNGTLDGEPILGKGTFHLYADLDYTPAGSPSYTPGTLYNGNPVPSEVPAGVTIGYENALALLFNTGYNTLLGQEAGTGGEMSGTGSNRFTTFIPVKQAIHYQIPFDLDGATFDTGEVAGGSATGITGINVFNFALHHHEDSASVGEGNPSRMIARNIRVIFEMDEPSGITVDSSGLGFISNNWLLEATGNSGWYQQPDNVFPETQNHE